MMLHNKPKYRLAQKLQDTDVVERLHIFNNIRSLCIKSRCQEYMEAQEINTESFVVMSLYVLLRILMKWRIVAKWTTVRRLTLLLFMRPWCRASGRHFMRSDIKMIEENRI